jgi:hypothetical protein
MSDTPRAIVTAPNVPARYVLLIMSDLLLGSNLQEVCVQGGGH